MSLNVKLILLSSTIIICSATAEAASIYEQKDKVCAAIMQKIETNLTNINDRDRIRDNKNMLQATLWGISYQQHQCDPEPYLNTIRRALD